MLTGERGSRGVAKRRRRHGERVGGGGGERDRVLEWVERARIAGLKDMGDAGRAKMLARN